MCRFVAHRLVQADRRGVEEAQRPAEEGKCGLSILVLIIIQPWIDKAREIKLEYDIKSFNAKRSAQEDGNDHATAPSKP